MRDASPDNVVIGPFLIERPILRLWDGEQVHTDDLSTEDMLAIADVVGVHAALRLIANFGGGSLYIPKSVKTAEHLSFLGDEAKEALCRAFGPDRIAIPVKALNGAAMARFIARRRGAGMTVSQIAREIGITRKAMQLSFPQSQGARLSRNRDPRDSDAPLTGRGHHAR